MMTEPPSARRRLKRVLVVAGSLLVLALFFVAYMVLFAPDEVVYQREIRKGNELVARAEAFRREHGRVPTSSELAIPDQDSMRFVYTRCSDQQYIVGFGTTLGESMSYTSDTRRWESIGRVCGH